MSAISGVITRTNSVRGISQNILNDLHEAVEVLKHRGPEGTGACGFCYSKQQSSYANDPIELKTEEQFDGVVCVNSICAFSNEPTMALDGQIILAYDGEIYNKRELREVLSTKGFHCEGVSDNEVIINMYLKFGFENMIKKLNGVFAIALVDLREGLTYLTIDRYGAKSIYYGVYDGKIVFASEMKGIIQMSDFERKIDIDALNARMIFSRPGGKVLLSGVSLIAPGTILVIPKRGIIKTIKYYNLDDYQRDNSKYKSFDEAMEEAEALLSDAVSCQLTGDGRIGIQLSGGIDSTLAAYYAKKIAGDKFTDAVAIIDGTGDKGEEKYIDYVGDALNLNVHKFQMTSDYFLNNYERMIWHNDAPAYKPYFVCFMKLGELAKQYVSVLFCGEGSDEFAGGYSMFASGVYQPFIKKLGLSGGSIVSYDTYADYAVLRAETNTDLLSIGYDGANKLIKERIDLFNGFEGSNFTKHLKFEISTCLPEACMRQEKMTMASSIVNRLPFLDNRLIDFLMKLPEDMLIRFGDVSPVLLSKDPLEWVQGKYIFKEITAKYFGHGFAYRKKMIMNLDDRMVVTSPGFKEYYHERIYPKMKARGIFDAVRVNQLFQCAATISRKDFTNMWRAITMETWCQLFIDSNKGVYR